MFFAATTVVLVSVWLGWITLYLVGGYAWRDAAVGAGVVASGTAVLLGVFIPRTYLMAGAMVRDKLAAQLPVLSRDSGITDLAFRDAGMGRGLGLGVGGAGLGTGLAGGLGRGRRGSATACTTACRCPAEPAEWPPGPPAPTSTRRGPPRRSPSTATLGTRCRPRTRSRASEAPRLQLLSLQPGYCKLLMYILFAGDPQHCIGNWQ